MGSSKTIFILIGFLLLLGCAPPLDEKLPEKIELKDIVGLIFDGSASRLENSGEYKSFEGQVSVLFERGKVEGEGGFRISYSNFREPSHCSYGQDCTCKGVLIGTYSKAPEDDGSAAAGAPEEQRPYNPGDPDVAEIEREVGSSSVIAKLQIGIDYVASSLSSGCPPQSDRTIKLTIYNTKKLVITDLGKDLLLSPRLR